MLDLGLDVLFKGKNMARLMGGLGVALKIERGIRADRACRSAFCWAC
ncbi:hypothetical protein ACKXF7_11275 [Faecalibacterium sp. 7]